MNLWYTNRIISTALRFKTPHLVCDIISFSTSSLPVWASQHAWLVTLRGGGKSAQETVVEYSVKTASQLVFTASRAAEVLDWMKDARSIPFCKHIGRNSTTLYFILRLEDYTRCWVVLQAVPDDEDAAHIDAIQDIGSGMTPTSLLAEDDTSNEGLLEEALQALPNRHQAEIGLLRVLVSLYDKINLEELEFDTYDNYPAASFNISMIRDAMKDVSQKDVLSGLVVSIISDIKQNLHQKWSLSFLYRIDHPLKNLPLELQRHPQQRHLVVLMLLTNDDGPSLPQELYFRLHPLSLIQLAFDLPNGNLSLFPTLNDALGDVRLSFQLNHRLQSHLAQRHVLRIEYQSPQIRAMGWNSQTILVVFMVRCISEYTHPGFFQKN
ncbi:hypothetical protein BDP27DRAFT_816396 [Rhodocollybia butyracea]|uniref:Uncharacterized protein n=1 Tax=Rhodocollybia butyracea TaxID=206335 RepID=A0A9P5U820_9AGAR|nr:hypothetical protein BDP27DRAFT_816396 [Rhodocollybia butyracea]